MAPARSSAIAHTPVQAGGAASLKEASMAIAEPNPTSKDVWSTARPSWIFQSKCRVLTLFFLIDFLIYLDRGIVPGAHDEFTRFLMQSDIVRRHPEVFFGMLQSVFIGGLAVAAPILAFLGARTQRPMMFLALGLGIWLVSIAMCAVAGLAQSVSLLFIARAASGVGEGAFIGLMAPILLDGSSTAHRGLILGIFYGLMPVGSAVGFITSAAVVRIAPWFWSFAGLTILAAAPIICLCIFAGTKAGHGLSPLKHFAESEDTNHELLSTLQTTTDCSSAVPQSEGIPADQDRIMTVSRHSAPISPTRVMGEPALLPTHDTLSEMHNESLSFMQCLGRLAYSPMFPALLISGAAQAAVAAGLISFGTAFLLNLGLFESELHASSAIGISGALAGSIGTLAGGWLLNLPQKWASKRDLDAHALVQRDESSWNGETEEEEKIRYNTVASITLFTAILAAFAACFLSGAPALMLIENQHSVSAAMVCVGVGLVLIFMTQSGLNLSVMLCAPQRYRFLSVSVFTLGLHLLGDVPGPIIVGYLKDLLAPSCSPKEEPIDISVNTDCLAERNRLLLTLLIFLSWSHFIWVGMSICSHKASRKLKIEPGLPLFDSHQLSPLPVSQSA